MRFQSTPPRGRRLLLSTKLKFSIHFNPLRREGGDWSNSGCLPESISDFNPLRREGGDIADLQAQINEINFNPLRREGGDTPCRLLRACPVDFNPLRREGGDIGRLQVKKQNKKFQSTPPRGRRHPGPVHHVCEGPISIHSAARAETEQFRLLA